jgi:hypothetical protein
LKTSLLVVDNFLKNPEAVRRRALACDFSPREYKGHEYNGITTDYAFAPWSLVEKAVGFKVRPAISFFRLGLAGDTTTTYIHADTAVDGAAWAGVLYLPAPECTAFSGTAFWRHNEYGWDRLPPSHVIESQTGAEADDAFFDSLNADGQTEDAWFMNGFVSMKSNRFVAYPTNLFHSRFPRDTWGKEKSEGRLTWVCFFDRDRSSGELES